MCTFGLSDCRVKPLRVWFRRSPLPQVQGVALWGFGLVGFRKLGQNSKTLKLAKVGSSPQLAKVGQRAGQSRFGQSRSSPKLAKVGQRAGQSRFGQSQHDHNNTPTDTHQLTPTHPDTHTPTHTHTRTHPDTHTPSSDCFHPKTTFIPTHPSVPHTDHPHTGHPQPDHPLPSSQHMG